MPRILLVIPCFKESQRLPGFLGSLCEALSRVELHVDVLVVDDGSGEEESEFLRRFVEGLRPRFPFVLPSCLLSNNRGKGGAVYAGWETASRKHDWLAFVDADGAISPAEVIRLLGGLPEESASRGLFAVRTGGGGTRVERTVLRRLTGKVFAWLVRLLFRLPVPDTQCGFKVVGREWFVTSRDKLIEERFCFDIELAHWLVASGGGIDSVPISWREAPGSHLGFRHVLQMFGSLLVLRRRLNESDSVAV